MALCRLKDALQGEGQTAATANDRCFWAFLEHDESPCFQISVVSESDMPSATSIFSRLKVPMWSLAKRGCDLSHSGER